MVWKTAKHRSRLCAANRLRNSAAPGITLLSFNRAYRAHLAAREMVEGSARDELGKALEEADQLYRVWDAVRDARSECYYVSVRRQALLTLQSALGPAAYFQGALPPHVPVWRFARRD